MVHTVVNTIYKEDNKMDNEQNYIGRCSCCNVTSFSCRANPVVSMDNSLYCETCLDKYMDYTSAEYNPYINLYDFKTNTTPKRG